MDETQKINALEQPYDEANETVPTRWEPEHVGRRLVRAFATLDRLPRPKGPRAPGGHWPGHVVEWADQIARAELTAAERRERDAAQNNIVLRPSAQEIAQMETAFDWLRELRAIDSGMAVVTAAWALRAARHRSITRLCRERGWAPHAFYRKRAKALTHLAGWLNTRCVPVF